MDNLRSVFITGATGFIGSHIVYKLLDQGCRVVILGRGKNVKERIDRLLSELYNNPEEYNEAKERMEVIGGDITREDLGISPEDFRRLRQRTHSVFHCAASVSFSHSEKEKTEEQNVGGTKNVLEFMRKLGLHELHYMSTAYVSGRSTGIIYEDDLDKGQAFNNSYEESKFKAERLVKEFGEKSGISATIYRPAIVIGDSKTGRTTNFWGFYGYIRSLCMIIKMLSKERGAGIREPSSAETCRREDVLHVPLRVPGAADKTLNLLPIDYAVDVIINIFNNRSGHGKTYHIVNPNPPTLAYTQKLVSDYLGIRGVEIVDPTSFQVSPANRWEKIFINMVKTFTAYLQNEEPVFSDANTIKILNGTGIKCPEISNILISNLVAYCINTNWGKDARCAIVFQ